jgi:hypothetical protein
MIAADLRPMSSAPLDGTPVRLFVFAGSVIASFWSEGRCRDTFGAGDYREGWYLYFTVERLTHPRHDPRPSKALISLNHLTFLQSMSKWLRT